MVCKECLENFPYLEFDQCGEIYDPDLGGTPLPDDPTGEEKYLCPNCLNKQENEQ